jgi:protein-disulfide isomerase
MAQYPRRRPTKPRRQRRLLLVIGAAVLIAAALIAASIVSARDGSGRSAAQAGKPAGAAYVASLFDGIPQNGTALGRADAPVTLVEYADLQCPYCAMWERNTLPSLVRDYVRDGKLRIEFRGLAFIGPDSETALRTALAAGAQNRLWNVVELFYLNQGAENSGWVDQPLLEGILRAAGLEPGPVLSRTNSSTVDHAVSTASAQAQAVNVRGTPSFEIGRTGQALQPFAPSSLDEAPFRTAIEQALAS